MRPAQLAHRGGWSDDTCLWMLAKDHAVLKLSEVAKTYFQGVAKRHGKPSTLPSLPTGTAASTHLLLSRSPSLLWLLNLARTALTQHLIIMNNLLHTSNDNDNNCKKGNVNMHTYRQEWFKKYGHD